MLKVIVSIIGGLIAAFAIVFVFDAVFHSLATGTAPADLTDREAMGAYVANQPPAALAVVLVGWAVAVFAGSAIAARFSRRGSWPGWVVTVFFLLATLANFLMVPHPVWLMAAAIVLILIAGWLGSTTLARQSEPLVGA